MKDRGKEEEESEEEGEGQKHKYKLIRAAKVSRVHKTKKMGQRQRRGGRPERKQNILFCLWVVQK